MSTNKTSTRVQLLNTLHMISKQNPTVIVHRGTAVFNNKELRGIIENHLYLYGEATVDELIEQANKDK